MRFTSPMISNGVSERDFSLDGIPGVLWTPAAAVGGRPLVLLAHGGGQHKRAPGLLAYAHRYVTACGFAVAAIDAPGHAGRPKTGQDEQFVSGMRERMTAGEPVDLYVAQHNADIAARALPEWQAVLRSLLELEEIGMDSPTGFWGMSLGTAIGMSLVAAEPTIKAAVLGLAGYHLLAEAATRIDIPIQFLLQWDDELIPRDSGLALFDAFASGAKTLHANPGRHAGIPAFELENSAQFFVRHLTSAPARIP